MAEFDPNEVLDEAESLVDQGRYEEALQRHVWFHDHILERQPYMSGVRLSFALSHWVELGERYPPARQTLVAVRDRKAEAIRRGDWSRFLFHDVASINDYLKEVTETGAIFLDLHRADPLRAVPFYPEAEVGLVARREYGVCGSYIPDAIIRFEEIRAGRRNMLPHADQLPEEHAPMFREVVEVKFAEEALRLVEILTAVGRAAEAERVRDLAMAETESTLTRTAISEWSPSLEREDPK